MIRLEQIGGPLRFQLEPGRQVTLGRSPQCELIVPDPSVSRRHAELEATAAGLHLRDLASANGTSLNGSKVTTRSRSPRTSSPSAGWPSGSGPPTPRPTNPSPTGSRS